MKSTFAVCLVVFAISWLAGAQEAGTPVLRPGVSVEMAAANHAVEVPAADAQDATVVSVTADGKIFVGVKPVEISALSSLKPGTVYVKADARVAYQKILTVLDALHGRPLVLLTASPANTRKGNIMPPYGVKLTVGGR
jgi:biopolymer transport protein ExbD